MLLQHLVGRLARPWNMLVRGLESAQPLAQLIARLYIGKVFFLSGLTKLRDWDTTLALFSDEYHVPVLPPQVAAVLGTTGETLLPVLLVLGFGGRFAALGLFVLNFVAANSLSDIAPAALQQHVFWGSLIAGLALWGPGKWSLENWWPGQRAAVGRPAALGVRSST